MNKHSGWFFEQRFLIAALVAGVVLGPDSPLQAYPLQVLTTNVQPLNGTDNGGDEFPGAVAPFGMMQWSPDTTPEESGGYVYSATQIVGFGLDHLSGAGCLYADFGNPRRFPRQQYQQREKRFRLHF
jgi:putative alpha-1,2-mannosidase